MGYVCWLLLLGLVCGGCVAVPLARTGELSHVLTGSRYLLRIGLEAGVLPSEAVRDLEDRVAFLEPLGFSGRSSFSIVSPSWTLDVSERTRSRTA